MSTPAPPMDATDLTKPGAGTSAQPAPMLTAGQEWRLYWKVVMAATVAFTFHSLTVYSMGLFMEPLSAEFGWTRAQVSAGMSLAAVSMIFLSPIAGAAIDRWGSRRLAVPGLILMIGCISSFGLANGSFAQWMMLWSLYALISLGVKATVWTQAVSSLFAAGRGLALGVTVSGVALAQTFVPFMANALIQSYGWRPAYGFLALIWGLPALILVILFFYDARDLARVPQRAKVAVSASDLPGLSMKQAMRSGPLWLIAVSTFITMFFGVGAVVHQVPILTEAGVSRDSAALIAGIVGIAGLSGKLITGWLMDRPHALLVGFLTLAASAIAFTLLLPQFSSPATIIIAMFVIGYSGGAKMQIGAYLTSRYGGMRNFGKIYGVMSSLIAMGSGLGPLLAGHIHDVYGSYGPFLIAGIPGSIICGLMIYILPPLRSLKEEQAAAAFR